MTTQQDKAARFAQLHAGPGAFFIPNPWDTGSARILEHMGFAALATTSAGFAWSRGYPDMGVTREDKMAHLRELCATVSLPVNADLQNGFGDRPEDAAETIRQAALAGAAGGSIEDATGRADDPIYDIGLARERISAAAQAARSAGLPFLLTGRAENHLWGRNDLADTIARLQAYQEAGADVLYAPGLRTLEEITTVVRSVDRPVNVLAAGLPFTLAHLEAAGVRRVSVGGALARAAYGALEQAGREMLEQGTMGYARTAPGGKHFNDIFSGR